MDFELEWELKLFREEQPSLFDEVGERYSATPIGDKTAKRMLNIINLLESALEKQSEQQSNCDLPHVSSSLRERELNKYLEEINTLMWNTWGVKHNKFDKEEGSKIMSILNRWANNDC